MIMNSMYVPRWMPSHRIFPFSSQFGSFPPMPRKKEPLSLTADLVALVDRREPDPGPEHGLAELTDDEYAAAASDFLARQGGGTIWVFAYGSLIWNPEFDFVEHRSCKAYGWRRSFSLVIERWRGTREQPGLMMTLDYGGSCHGVAFRLPDDDRQGRMERLLRRESSYKEDLSCFRWIDVWDGDRKLRAMVFWAAPRADGYYLSLPIEEQAIRLARAAGHVGTCAEYLYNTIAKLEEHGIHDTYLWRLQKLVAAEIRRMHPGIAGD
jgi:cation transport protein ChaC